MRKSLILLIAVFVFSMSLMAQNQTPPSGDNFDRKELRQNRQPRVSAKERAERIAKDLELTDAEKANLQTLFEKQDGNIQKRQVEKMKMKESLMAQEEVDRKAETAELEKILGKEKFQKYESKMSECPAKMKGNPDVPMGRSEAGQCPEAARRCPPQMCGSQMPPMGNGCCRQDQRSLEDMGCPMESRKGEKPILSAQERAEKLARQFELSDAEKSKIQALYEKQDAEREQLKAETKKLLEAQRSKIEAARNVQDAELEKIMGKEKFEKLQAKRAENKEMKQGMEDRLPMSPMGFRCPQDNGSPRQGGCCQGGNQMPPQQNFGSPMNQMPCRGMGSHGQNVMPRRGMEQVKKINERPRLSAKEKAEKMAKQLELTDAQKAKVQVLFEKQDAKREQRKTEKAKLRETKKAQLEAERKIQNAELEKIIGKEKFAKLQAKQAEHRERLKLKNDRDLGDFRREKGSDPVNELN